MRARFLKPAELEVDEAIAYFDAQRPGLGERFERDLFETVAFISDYPLTGTRLGSTTRRHKLRTFKYHVIYVAEPTEVVIVAVAHRRRRPGYWIGRLNPLR